MSAAATSELRKRWYAPWTIWVVAGITAVELGMLVWMLLPAHFHGWRVPGLFILLCGTQFLNLARFVSERKRRSLERS